MLWPSAEAIKRERRMKLFGYPMKRIEVCSFVDRVTGESVGVYLFKGKKYLATSKWSLFKVLKGSEQ